MNVEKANVPLSTLNSANISAVQTSQLRKFLLGKVRG